MHGNLKYSEYQTDGKIITLNSQHLQDINECYAVAMQKHHLPSQHMCTVLQCPAILHKHTLKEYKQKHSIAKGFSWLHKVEIQKQKERK